MGELLANASPNKRHPPRPYPSVEFTSVDMFDPNHNAHGKYYLVDGDFNDSWKHVQRHLIMAVWGGEPREAACTSLPTRVSDPRRMLL
jgi:hypothetical protein